VPLPQKSRLANGLARGDFVVSVGVTPPKGYRADDLLEQVRRLRILGVDAIQVSEGRRAGARMSPLSLAVLIEQQAGIETLLNYTCRDHSLLGMQSDLLGAHAMGLRNLLVTTGNPPVIGDYPRATGVFDVDAVGLTNVVNRLNHGLDVGGAAIGVPTSFHLGVAADPTAFDVELELRRFAYKVEAGAEFAVTQPIFDVAALRAFLARLGAHRIPVIAGLWVFDSLRNAEYLANEVPGTRVPPALVDRMRAAEDRGQAAEEGVAIARETLAAIAAEVQGVQVGTPGRNMDALLSVLEAVA
jgi:homocysteine S-methyltransferase